MKKLKGKNALALAECCKWNKKKKEAEKKLKAARAKLKLDKEGDYKNDAGDILTISEVEKKKDIDPQKLFKAMKKQKKQKRFWDVIKVHLTTLKTILSLEEVEAMQEDAPSTLKFVFK